MTCSRELIEAYLDQELDAAQQAVVDQHVAACAACSETWARLRKLKEGIKAAAPYYPAPPGLEQAIRRDLRRPEDGVARPARAMPWRWLTIAASVLLAASVSWNVVQLRSRTPGSELADSVLSDHIRSLLGTRLVDVPSSDRHTVKPWFAGKLDFAPNVKDLEAEGFPLVGGRIEYLAGRRVAALVYRRRQHVINLFIWPNASSARGDAALARKGYNLVHWTDDGMTYWAVSDVSTADLEQFRTLFRQP